jgi:antitoxin component HigA of HigAB toxin-antitoxin module
MIDTDNEQQNTDDVEAGSSVEELRLVLEIFGHNRDDLAGIVGAECADALLCGEQELTPEITRAIAEAWEVDLELLADA